MNLHSHSYFLPLSSLQEKGSNEVVFKAMGRAINKTVTIVELIKVLFPLSLTVYIVLMTILSDFDGNVPFAIFYREELGVFIRIPILDLQTSLIYGNHLRKACFRKCAFSIIF